MMRDIALIYLLRVTYRGPTVAALLVLFLFLYAAPVPILLHGDKGLLLLFVADPRSTIIGWIIPWAEAALAWFALWRLLRRPRTAPAG
jgi:hypothetical protein